MKSVLKNSSFNVREYRNPKIFRALDAAMPSKEKWIGYKLVRKSWWVAKGCKKCRIYNYLEFIKRWANLCCCQDVVHLVPVSVSYAQIHVTDAQENNAT
uniref:Uncharacterized protein n=1 Tax=Romanomermis culicivorax TaxID=13658 RepID=A0A915KYH1_ROMCU